MPKRFNESYIQYTFEHRLAFRFVVETILEDDEDYDVMVARAEAHEIYSAVNLK